MVRFGDALAGAVAKEYGREVVAACTEDDWGDPCTLIMMSDATDPDTYWWLLVRESEQLNWETRPAREDRRAALRFRLTTLTKNNGRVGTSLRDVDYSKDEVFGYLLVRLWWQARMSEGHTSETARLLLGLSVPTYLLALLAFPADGPPTLRDGTDH